MKLIDKDVLVAEIERRIKSLHQVNSPREQAVLYECKDIISFIDSLEEKDVNLEKEFDKYTKNILACDVQFEPFTHLYNCAKYFFELGLKAQKGE